MTRGSPAPETGPERDRNPRSDAGPANIGTFEILGELGRGGMGVVYRARDPRLDREVALKVLPPEIASDPERLQRLRREARLLASLNHPNIGAIYSLEETADGGYVLVLELIEGASLRERLEAGPCPTAEATRLAEQIAGALEAAHNRGVIHRDLKPDNIRLTPEGTVKVLDFGLAFNENARGPGIVAGVAPERGPTGAAGPMREDGPSPEAAASVSEPRVTGTDDDGATQVTAGPSGLIEGTPGYMSPEQARGADQDRRTDLFSFGCILFECLAGRAAFGGSTWMERIAASLSIEPDWDALPASTPPPVREMVRLCLRKDPAERLSSMTEVRRILEAGVDERTFVLPAGGFGSAGPVTPGNLPRQLNRFVGREREITEVMQLMAKVSLLTLTGVGGGGKTRLALRVAEEFEAAFPDGRWLAELGPLSDPEQVAATVARVLGLREEPGRSLPDLIAAGVGQRSVLVILDNCEHLLDAAGHLAEHLLQACPRLKILVTSREPLGIGGETVWRVPSLATTPTAEGSPGEAAELFVDRARSVVPAFRLEGGAIAIVQKICARLDGIPLAIELAASRVRLLSVEQILAKLDDRFRLLTGGSRTALERHQTLRATVDWSYGLLSAAEKRLLRHLSVFAGGWTLEAATAVSGADADEFEVLDSLAHLVDKSLVAMEEAGGAVRYRMLETVRQFAREELDRSNEGGDARERHLRFFLSLAEDGEAGLKGRDQKAWLERLEVEHENMLSALRWAPSCADGTETALRLAAALTSFWLARGHFVLGRAAVAEVLALPGVMPPERTTAAEEAGTEPLHPDLVAHPLLRARMLTAAGTLALGQGEWPVARHHFEDALDLWRGLGDRAGISRASNLLGVVLLRLGEVAAARRSMEESLELARALGERSMLPSVLNNLGSLAMNRQDNEAAYRHFEEAALILRDLGNRLHLAVALGNQGHVAQRLGDTAAADRCYSESLALHLELGNRPGAAGTLTLLGQSAWTRGEYAEARRRWTEALTCYRDIGSRRGEADILNNLGLLALDEENLAEAGPLFEESLAIQRELGSLPREALVLANLGLVRHREGRRPEAAECYRRSLEIRADAEEFAEAIGLIEGSAALAAETGRFVDAARLIGAAQQMRVAFSRSIPEPELRRLEEIRAKIRGALGEERCGAAEADGERMTPGEAIRVAMDGLEPAS